MKFGQTFESSAPVISLTIIDRATLERGVTSNTTKILAVVRDPKTNATHPNVVSVPTQRIPASLHMEILEARPEIQGLLNTRSYATSMVDNGFTNGHNPIIYAVESLLSSKLGLAEHLESGELRFQAGLRIVKAGKSYQLSNLMDEQVHYILMANIFVIVSDGTSVFPPNTASYSQISWVEIGQFISMVEQKNPELLGTGLNAIEYCVYGLCLSTTYDLLSDVLGKDPYESVR